MKNLEILKEDEINNYNEDDILKVYETYSILNGLYSNNDKIEILRSLYVKVGNSYKIYNSKHEISKENYKVINNILNTAYENSNMKDEIFKQYLKPLAIQKAFYDENTDLNDGLSAEVLYYLFGYKVKKYNSLDDYYKDMAYKYGTNIVPGWTTLGYAIESKKVKVKRR